MITQIYEIQTPGEAEEVITLGVGHVGSVIVDQARWKQPTIRETLSRVRQMKATSSLIPLFSEATAVCRSLDYYRPDLVHFCEALPAGDTGSLSACLGLQRQVRERFPEIRIMRSIPIQQPGLDGSAGEAAVRLACEFAQLTDFFLTDTLLGGTQSGASGDQPVTGFIGITGKTCDWAAAKRLVDATPVPVILAGGLSPENVFDAIVQVLPAGVDSCTGTNALDPAGNPIRFEKDLARVKRFIEETRRAEKALAARMEPQPKIP